MCLHGEWLSCGAPGPLADRDPLQVLLVRTGLFVLATGMGWMAANGGAKARGRGWEGVRGARRSHVLAGN